MGGSAARAAGTLCGAMSIAGAFIQCGPGLLDGLTGGTASGDVKQDGQRDTSTDAATDASSEADAGVSCDDAGNFCDDFDRGDLGARWTGFIVNGSGRLSLSDATVTSAPNALRADIVEAGS